MPTSWRWNLSVVASISLKRTSINSVTSVYLSKSILNREWIYIEFSSDIFELFEKQYSPALAKLYK